MMDWILRFAPEDGQKQCQSAGSWIWPCAWKKYPVILVLQIISGYVDYIWILSITLTLSFRLPSVVCKKGFFTTYKKEEQQICEVAMRMKGKMNLLNTAQGALLYIIWIVAGVMKLINHRKSQWRWSQQFPIRTMLCITQNLHKGEYQSLVVFFFKSECLLWLSWVVWKSCISLDSLGELILLLGAAGSRALRYQRLADKSQAQSGQWGPEKIQHHCRVRGSEPKATEAQRDGKSAQQPSWAGLSRILRICKSTGHYEWHLLQSWQCQKNFLTTGEILNFALENNHFELFVMKQYIDVRQCLKKKKKIYLLSSLLLLW